MNLNPTSTEPVYERAVHRTLFAFLLTFIVSRILVFLIMSRRIPNLFLFLRGTHVHHLNYGIFLLATVAGYLLFKRPAERAADCAALAYGFAMALTFDEFGMWLHLGGSYWQRASVDAIIILAALLALLAFAPSLERLESHHFFLGLYGSHHGVFALRSRCVRDRPPAGSSRRSLIASARTFLFSMKTFTHYMVMNTPQRKELINITEAIEKTVAESGIREGMILVSAYAHSTAGVFVNDEEQGLKKDIMSMLERLAPVGDYEHHRTGEDNGDAHLKRILVNHQVILPITKGKLDLGPWEQVFYAEFDGQRKKRIILKALGE